MILFLNAEALKQTWALAYKFFFAKFGVYYGAARLGSADFFIACW